MLTVEQMQEMAALRAEGLTWPAIGARFGASASVAAEAVKRLPRMLAERDRVGALLADPLDEEGIPRVVYGIRRRIVWTPAVDDYIRRRKAEGAGNVLICAELGVGQASIGLRSRELGVPVAAGCNRKDMRGRLTDEEKAKVEAAWKDGATMRQIGEMLGRSKDAAVGHVHRMKLAGRTSPIKTADPAAPPKSAVTDRPPWPPGSPQTWGILTWMSGGPMGEYDYQPPNVVGKRNAETAPVSAAEPMRMAA